MKNAFSLFPGTGFLGFLIWCWLWGSIGSSYASEFINSPYHNELMPLSLRETLIAKGYSLICKINQGEAFAEIDHKLECFPDSAQKFSHQYTLTLHPPTLANINRKLQKLTSSQTEPSVRPPRQAGLESLIAVFWALSDFASRTNDCFISGSFSIVDPDSYLFSFFCDYAKLATGKDISQLAHGPTNAFNPYGDGFAYNRDPQLLIAGSTHYPTLTESQLGIDTRFQSSAYAIEVLPYQKSHLLVGRIKSPIGLPSKTFLKAEYYGLGDIVSTVMHTQQLVSRTIHKPMKKRGENEVPNHITAAFLPLAYRAQHVKFEYLFQPIDSLRELLESIMALSEGGNLPQYSLSTLTAFTYLVYRDTEDRQARDLALSFYKALEATYHDGILTNEGILSTTLSIDHKAFHRNGNEIVLYLHEIKGV